MKQMTILILSSGLFLAGCDSDSTPVMTATPAATPPTRTTVQGQEVPQEGNFRYEAPEPFESRFTVEGLRWRPIPGTQARMNIGFRLNDEIRVYEHYPTTGTISSDPFQFGTGQQPIICLYPGVPVIHEGQPRCRFEN